MTGTGGTRRSGGPAGVSTTDQEHGRATPETPGVRVHTRINEPIEPMTLGNMRANGVRSLAVSCHLCHTKPSSARPRGRMTCRCRCPCSGRAWSAAPGAGVGADARPNWREQPPRESLSGVQWR
jgi:hypothetical protein